ADSLRRRRTFDRRRWRKQSGDVDAIEPIALVAEFAGDIDVAIRIDGFDALAFAERLQRRIDALARTRAGECERSRIEDAHAFLVEEARQQLCRRQRSQLSRGQRAEKM